MGVIDFIKHGSPEASIVVVVCKSIGLLQGMRAVSCWEHNRRNRIHEAKRNVWFCTFCLAGRRSAVLVRLISKSIDITHLLMFLKRLFIPREPIFFSVSFLTFFAGVPAAGAKALLHQS